VFLPCPVASWPAPYVCSSSVLPTTCITYIKSTVIQTARGDRVVFSHPPAVTRDSRRPRPRRRRRRRRPTKMPKHQKGKVHKHTQQAEIAVYERKQETTTTTTTTWPPGERVATTMCEADAVEWVVKNGRHECAYSLARRTVNPVDADSRRAREHVVRTLVWKAGSKTWANRGAQTDLPSDWVENTMRRGPIHNSLPPR